MHTNNTCCYENSDKTGVEEESLTLFLAVQLIRDTPQAVGVKVEQPQPGSEDEQLCDPYANQYSLLVFWAYFK